MTDERTIAYLLDELSPEELERFEDECFAQENWPQEIDLAEEDLIDAYLRQELSRERRERFERNYLITQVRQERVAHAAALLRHIDESNAESAVSLEVAPVEARLSDRLKRYWLSSPWGVRVAAVFALVAVTVGLTWFLLLRPPATITYAIVTLTPAGNNRAGQGSFERMRLTRGSGLKASLKLPDADAAAPKYKVRFENDDGKVVQEMTVPPEEGAVTILVPASKLSTGKYDFKVLAVSLDGSEEPLPGSYRLIIE